MKLQSKSIIEVITLMKSRSGSVRDGEEDAKTQHRIHGQLRDRPNLIAAYNSFRRPEHVNSKLRVLKSPD